MATGDVTATIRADGWSADVTVEGRAAWLGTATVDVGTPGSTSTGNLYWAVTSEGYSAAGALGTVARTVYGTKLVAMPYGTQAIPGTLSGTFTDGETVTQAVSGATGKVYGASQGATHAHLIIHTITGVPNGANVWTGGTSAQTVTPSGAPAARTNDERVVGSDIVYRIALSEYIFDDDKNGGAGTSGTDPVMTAKAGLFAQGGNNSNLSTGNSTNSSAKDYPVAFGQWDVYAGVLHRSRVKADFITACNAFHGFGVAAVRFNSVGGTSSVDSESYITSETPTKRTATNLYGWAHQRTVTLSAFTQGETITSRFRIYPKVGDANSVFDTSGRTTAGEECLCYNEHSLICDKSNALDVIRYVSSTGNDTTGDGSSGNPWLTISKATTTATVNVVRLMGTSTTYNTGSAATRKTTSEWVVVEADNGATPTVRFTTTLPYRVQRLLFSGLPIIPNTTASYLDGENLNYVGFRDCAFSRNGVGNSTAAGPSFRSLSTYFINCTGDLSHLAWDFGSFSTTAVAPLLDGCILADGTDSLQNWYRVVACKCNGKLIITQKNNTNASIPIQNNVVVAYNKVYGGTSWSGAFFLECVSKDNQTGVAVVGNVIHKGDGTAGAFAFAGNTQYTASNFIFAHNTVQPATDTARNNLFYNDGNLGGTLQAFYHSDIYAYGNDLGNANIKSDQFANSAACIGNWTQLYGCGWRYNNFDTLSSGSFDWAYRGIGGMNITATYVNAGAYDYTPDTGSASLDTVDQSGNRWRYWGDLAGTYASINSTAQANVGALQPVPTVTITAGGVATSDGGSTDLGTQSDGALVGVEFTAGGLTGATLYVTTLTGTGGVTGADVDSTVTSGASGFPPTAFITLDDSGSGHVQVAYSIGDGTYDFDLTWDVSSGVFRMNRTGRPPRMFRV